MRQGFRGVLPAVFAVLALTVSACSQEQSGAEGVPAARQDTPSAVGTTPKRVASNTIPSPNKKGSDMDTSELSTGMSCAVPEGAAAESATASGGTLQLTDEEWRRRLSPEAYEILRHKGTERAFTGKYYKTKDPGVYVCAACGAELFSSETKFDSGSGWPSYWKPIGAGRVTEHRDLSYGMIRTEVVCSRCGGHLGHVFDDGPEPTGLRYCINSASLEFKPKAK